MARFPYLAETISYIRENGPSLEDLNTSRVYNSIRALGKERVLDALKNSEIPDRPIVTESEAIQEILSYVVARILVSSVNSHYLIKRYALSESLLLNNRLQKEPVELMLSISSELGVVATVDDPNSPIIKLHVTDYLKHSSSFRDEKWKLVNRDLNAGQIPLERREFIRLLQHAIQVKIESELPLPVNSKMVKIYESEINELKALLGSIKKKYEIKDFGSLDLGKLPPCMKQILAMAQAGENLSHSARFAITAFLHTIGLDAEEILKIFGKSPDFDPSIARYQVEHIAGVQSGTEYIPPSCGKMKSYGICYNPDSLCSQDWLNHPLTYYRTKSKKGGEPKSKRKTMDRQKQAGQG